MVWSEKGYLGHFEAAGKPCRLIEYTADLISLILDLAQTWAGPNLLKSIGYIQINFLGPVKSLQ